MIINKKNLILLFLQYNYINCFTNILRLNKPSNILRLNKPFTNIKMINKLNKNEFGDFNWKKNWYPIALEKYTDKKNPFKFTLLGENLVIWWDHKNKKWNSMIDKCPHKLVPLSEGRINNNGNIECPYHGWTFNCTGNCISIPHHPNYKIKKHFNGKAYYTTNKQGIIWIWPENIEINKKPPDKKLIPICKELDDKNTFYLDTFSDLPYDYTLLVENVLDISHVPYTHHGSQGLRKNAYPIKYKKKLFSNFGIILNHNLSVIPGSYNNNISLNSVTYFQAPCYQYTKVENKHIKILLASYAVPINEGYSRVIVRLPIIKFKNPLLKILNIFLIKPTFLHHMFISKVLEEDTIFLNGQQNILLFNNKNLYKLPTSSDTPTILWRKWLNNTEPIPWKSNRLNKKYIWATRSELLDRKTFHLDHCTTCQKAYNNLEIIKKILIFLMPNIIFLGVPLLQIYNPINNILFDTMLCATILGILGNLLYICDKLQSRMVKGPYPPKRNI